MSFRPRATQVAICIAGVCLLGVACAHEASGARPPQIGEWIQQLGDESYEARENAYRDLAALGLEAKPELLAGMRDKDPEIRWRCARLWEAVREKDFQLRAEAFLNDPDASDKHQFPGWDRYRTLFGTSSTARQTFLSLQQEELLLWEEYANASDASPPRFLERCRQLRSALEDRQRRSKIARGTALTVLLLTETYESMISAEDRRWMSELWNLTAVVDIVQSDETWESFKSQWFSGTRDPRPAFERLMARLGNGRDEVIPIARELLQDQAIPSNQKQFALLALANSGLPEDDILVQGFLNDASVIDTYFSRGKVIKSQLRDIALATLIVRAGKDPAEFGFKYLREDDRTLFAPSTLGFQADDERRAAFEKWLGREDGGKQ
jgi:hypothetical protein